MSAETICRSECFIVTSVYSSLEWIVGAVVAKWPEHKKFIQTGLYARSQDSLRHSAETANLVKRLVGDELDRFIDGYRWMCDMILSEEIEFRRTGRYRYSSFASTNRQVYQDKALMARYMDGLLLSQIFFDNHQAMLEFYQSQFLSNNRLDYRHLEIGPGHGLLLYYAACDPRCGEVTAWDISPTSIAHTRECLRRLGVERAIDLRLQDIITPAAGNFDSIVFSEVMEHLEEPQQALSTITRLLAPDGRLFVNVPVNSPAIDHIYLLNTPEEAVKVVTSAGLEIVNLRVAPVTGYSEERARRTRSAISCGIIAKRTI
jgi:2-polyprenyl-3-methyl-5-hydroxy-6-metoxy-1,4-benzoquinol methylase